MSWPWLLGGAAAGVLGTLIAQNVTTAEKKVAHELPLIASVDDPHFLRLMGSLLGPPVLPGNRVDILQDGDGIFPAMLGAIAQAQRTICLETYIWWAGATGRSFSEALSARARAGCAVHVIIDGVGGASIERGLVEAMRAAGVQLERFHPPSLRALPRMNKRTHRKLLVVDGCLGFTGGVGIADQWQGRAQDPQHWRDTHFRVAGPAVAQMQAAFLDNWLVTRAEVQHSPDYFPPLEPAGGVHAQLFTSSSDDGSESTRLMYLLSLAAARRSIDIAASYFVPDDLVRHTLVQALARGVRVRIVVPGPWIDARVTRRASRARWGPLLRAGAAIHEFQPTMYHVKALIVDALWASVGSTNFDSRSFRLNDEANLNVHDAAFAAELTAAFERDLARARPVTLAEWERRPLGERLRDRVAALGRSQL